MRFEWDTNKDRINQAKHGVSFDDAKGAFYDERGLLLDDPDHSTEEERFVLLGMSFEPRLLVVCHCYRENDDMIRIISARKANRREHRLYGEQS